MYSTTHLPHTFSPVKKNNNNHNNNAHILGTKWEAQNRTRPLPAKFCWNVERLSGRRRGVERNDFDTCPCWHTSPQWDRHKQATKPPPPPGMTTVRGDQRRRRRWWRRKCAHCVLLHTYAHATIWRRVIYGIYIVTIVRIALLVGVSSVIKYIIANYSLYSTLSLHASSQNTVRTRHTRKSIARARRHRLPNTTAKYCIDAPTRTPPPPPHPTQSHMSSAAEQSLQTAAEQNADGRRIIIAQKGYNNTRGGSGARYTLFRTPTSRNGRKECACFTETQ